MSPLRLTYLCLALLGAALPMRHSLAFLAENGWRAGLLLDAWLTDLAARALFSDLALTGLALTVWVIAETAVRRNWEALLALPAAWLIGPACGLPLYLFLRTRPVR